MKQRVTRFKSLKVALKELEPFIRNGQHLSTGRAFEGFGGLRSRELLAGWILCVVLNAQRSTPSFSFTSDPQGGDGVIYDSTAKIGWPTEHIFIPRAKEGEIENIETRMLGAIMKKQGKGGHAYASGKTLVIFVDDGRGQWFPNTVMKQIPRNDFSAVWAVGLHDVVDDQYTYWTTLLLDESRTEMMNAPSWLVRIGQQFDSWKVERLQ